MPAQAPSYVEQTQQVLALRQREAEVRRQRDRDLETLFGSIAQSREEVAKALRVYQERIGEAQQAIRRTSSEDSAHYRVGLTLQVRMAGAIHQALSRAESMDRKLAAVKADRLERERLEARQQSALALKQVVKEVQQSLLPQTDDFELLYGEDALPGEEEVAHAS